MTNKQIEKLQKRVDEITSILDGERDWNKMWEWERDTSLYSVKPLFMYGECCTM